MQARVHSLESFGSADGPGVRFLIFLQGCRMRCLFCHNPDTWDLNGGTLMESDDILKQAVRYRPYWGEEGGITVSGGEPLLQIDFLIDLFTKAKQQNINTCIDTAGEPFSRNEPLISKFHELNKVTDLYMVDIKHIDPGKHLYLTGKDNANILDFFKFLNEENKNVWLRHVLVPSISDDDEYLHKTRTFIAPFKNISRIDVLPYHTLGIHKWEKLGIDYPLKGISPPSKERVQNALDILNGLK